MIWERFWQSLHNWLGSPPSFFDELLFNTHYSSDFNRYRLAKFQSWRPTQIRVARDKQNQKKVLCQKIDSYFECFWVDGGQRNSSGTGEVFDKPCNLVCPPKSKFQLKRKDPIFGFLDCDSCYLFFQKKTKREEPKNF